MAIGTGRTYGQFSKNGKQSVPTIYLCSINGEINSMGTKVPQNKSSRERKFPSEWARERIGQGAKGPGNDLAIGPIGRFATGSELAQERK